MQKISAVFLIGALILTGCSTPAASTETPTLPEATATQSPTSTAIPPTPTSEPTPTPTPAPIAVPLIYKGWQDKAYSRVCVDAVISGNEEDLDGKIISTATALLKEMGMQVVPVEGGNLETLVEGGNCEALYAFLLSIEALGANYSGGGQTCFAYAGAELYGDLLVTQLDNDDWFTIPLHGTRETSLATMSCDAIPPFSSLWPKAILEGFSKIYGFKALEAALMVPALRFEVSKVLQEGKYSAEETLPVLMKTLQSDDPTLVKAALVSLAEYREKAAPAVPLLIPLLTHSDKWLATLAADCLRMIGPGAEAAIPALLVAIDDPDIRLGPQAAFALGTIGRPDEEVLAALMRHVADPNFSMAMFVQSSLERLTGENFTQPKEWQDWWDQRTKPAQ